VMFRARCREAARLVRWIWFHRHDGLLQRHDAHSGPTRGSCNRGGFLGGLGLIFGLFTRVAAFGIFCNMLVAVAMVHHQFGLFMNWTGTQKGEGFEFHLLVLAIAVSLMIRGAGAASIDRLWSSSGKNGIRTQVRTQAA